MTRYRIRVVEPALIKDGADRLAIRILVRALVPEIPAARRRWLIERANLPGRTMTAVGEPRWWESATARADASLAPALAAYRREAGDTIATRQEASS